MKTAAIILLSICAVAFAQQKNSFTDPRDNKKYKIVRIGEQTWTAENLNYNASGSKCYDNKPANCNKYGRLYDWETSLKSCPSGWHLPSDAEWNVLTDTVGGFKTEGKLLKAKSGWNRDNMEGKSGNGEDKYGFAALPGGGFYYGGGFGDAGYYGYWWSTSEYNASSAYIRKMSSGEYAFWSYSNNGELFSVRCVQNNKKEEEKQAEREKAIKEASGSFIDTRNNKKYKTIKIGTQTWMAENLNYNAKGSKCGNDSVLSDANTSTCDTYGRLYNWVTAMALPSSCNSSSCYSQISVKHKGICPSGWHLPSLDEWDVLTDTVGGEETDGKHLKAKSGWKGGLGESGNGSDTYGFAALPSGFGSDGNFDNVGQNGSWWAASEVVDASRAFNRNISGQHKAAYWLGLGKSILRSVRCLKD